MKALKVIVTAGPLVAKGSIRSIDPEAGTITMLTGPKAQATITLSIAKITKVIPTKEAA